LGHGELFLDDDGGGGGGGDLEMTSRVAAAAIRVIEIDASVMMLLSGWCAICCDIGWLLGTRSDHNTVEE
jgi:hypothetical protein